MFNLESGYDTGLTDDKIVRQLNYLKISGIAGFKPLMKCNKTIQALEKYPDQIEYYYLGQYKGVYHLTKMLNVDDPHFYLEKSGNTFSIWAIVKFYPCPSHQTKDANAKLFLNSYNSAETVLQV